MHCSLKKEEETTDVTPTEVNNLPVTSVYPVELDEVIKIINMQVSDVMVQLHDGKVYLNENNVKFAHEVPYNRHFQGVVK